MPVTNVERSKGVSTRPDTLEATRLSALREPCALKVDELVGKIVFQKSPVANKAQALLDIAVARNDLPIIQNRICTELLILDAEKARVLISFVLKQPIDEDRDVLRARIFSAIVEMPSQTPEELATLAAGLKDRFPTVRRQIHSALVGLPRDRFDTLQKVVSGLAEGREPLVRELSNYLADIERGRLSSPPRILPPPLPKKSHPPQHPATRKNTVAQERLAARARLVAERRATAPAPSPKRPPPSPAPGSLMAEPIAKPLPPPPASQKPAMPVASSISDLRSPSLQSKTWGELQLALNTERDPIESCAIIAEMATRFDREMVLSGSASRLTYLASHQEVDVKKRAGLLINYLLPSRN